MMPECHFPIVKFYFHFILASSICMVDLTSVSYLITIAMVCQKCNPIYTNLRNYNVFCSSSTILNVFSYSEKWHSIPYGIKKVTLGYLKNGSTYRKYDLVRISTLNTPPSVIQPQLFILQLMAGVTQCFL